MTWNWQQPDWPDWRWDSTALEAREAEFLHRHGRLAGVWHHLDPDDRDAARVAILTDEAVTSSAIEGEVLDRASVQSSVRRAFGLTADRRAGVAESGIAELVSAVYADWGTPLTADALGQWHAMICRGRTDLTDLGRWRGQGDPMQVVSGPYQKPKVHFEAPPAAQMPLEMARFIDWFNDTTLPALTRAGLAHLWFVSVHPFEDGNGRAARALSEKALAQAGQGPSLAALSREISRHRNAYYDQLERHNKAMEITGWLIWFSDSILAAQDWSERMLAHLIAKTRTMDRLRDQLNDRQTRVMLRLFEAGPDGFTGGLSAKNYITLTGTSPATARRDLSELVALGALTRTGERKGTRYWLTI